MYRLTHWLLFILFCITCSYFFFGHSSRASYITADKHTDDVRNDNVIRVARKQTGNEIESNIDSACGHNVEWKTLTHQNLPPMTSNMSRWYQKDRVECPNLNYSAVRYNAYRAKFSLICSPDVQVNISLTNNTSDIYTVPYGDECVSRYIDGCCSGNKRVPNVVHYVWYKKGALRFEAFTSLVSAIRFVDPCMIIFHGDTLPYGKYWDYLIHLFPKIVHMKRTPNYAPFGFKLAFNEHVGAVMRIQTLILYGGIYIDSDQLLVRSVELFRQYPVYMSFLNNGLLGCFFIMAERNAAFLHLWLDGYRNHYNNSYYVYSCMIYPKIVARAHTDLIHVDYGINARPMDLVDVDLYDPKFGEFNWSAIYSIHLFVRIMNETYNEFTIRTMSTLVGSISRHIIYGNKEMCIN